jgi:hypothetical protein
MLPSNLKNRAQAFAAKRGISVGELIRESLEQTLHQAKGQRADPFFEDTHFYTGDVPTDFSSQHDDYLHDDIH